jgi:hypothetical protein
MQQSNMERVKLAHDLDLNKLLTEAGEDFAEGRAGSMLLFISKKGSSYKPMAMAIEYVSPSAGKLRAPDFGCTKAIIREEALTVAQLLLIQRTDR